ncbi:hypothetical protein LINGRAHAP2_LOCUS10888 [Linum grandiflorum]
MKDRRSAEGIPGSLIDEFHLVRGVLGHLGMNMEHKERIVAG